MFEGFQAIPLFLQFAPRLRARAVDPRVATRRLNRTKRDIVDNPFGQLIDFVWCLLHRASHGEWPENFPSDKVISRSLNDFQGELAQLRAGRPNLTIAQFGGLWPDSVRNAGNEIMGPPDTLLAVAHLWKLMKLKLQPRAVDECYMHAWSLARRKLSGDSEAAKVSGVPWPEYMDRGLDCPAPE